MCDVKSCFRKFLGAGLLALTLAAPELCAAKKIIHCGWDQQGGEYLEQNYQELEKRLPFDGLNITLKLYDAAGNSIGRSGWLWQRTPWTRENLSRDLEALKRCRFSRFTDNFIYTGANGDQSEAPDWFDDEFWENVSANMGLMAYAAREAQCRGLVFDPESYTSFNWRYHPESGRSYEETVAAARGRGRQIMRAWAAEYPNMTVMFYWLLSMAQLSDPAEFSNISYGLYPAFINGLLDEMPPEMRLVDASENGYWTQNRATFLNIYHFIRSGESKAIAPENKEKYLRQVFAGFGLYLDSHPFRNGYSVPPVDGSILRAFRFQLQNALDVSDEFVWVYGEHRKWLTDVPEESWESVLPGVTRAIELARNPEAVESMIQQAIAEKHIKNLVADGEFSATASTDERQADLDWRVCCLPGFQEFGTQAVEQDGAVGGNRPGAAKVPAKTILIYSMPVRESERYFIKVRKLKGNSSASMEACWQTEGGNWCNQQNNRVRYFPENPEEEWTSAETTVSVPAGAGRLVLLMHAGTQTAWFDDVEIYRIDDLYETP